VKILFVIDSFGSGGAQRQIINLAMAFAASDHVVHIVAYKNINNFFLDELKNSDIQIHQPAYSRGLFGNLRTLISLRSVVFHNDIDVIISFQLAANVYSSLARWPNKRPFLIVSDRTSTYAPVTNVNNVLRSIAYYLSDHIVANSKSRASDLRYRYASKVSAIWNGYKISDHIFFERQHNDTLHKIGIVGRIHKAKNPLRMLDALRLYYMRTGCCPKVTWAGRIDSDPDSLLLSSAISDYLNQYTYLRESVTFVGEISDVTALYSSIDVLLHVSIYEGLPNVICESMLAGCPVIASRISDNEQLLQNGDLGILCDPNEPDDICKALIDFSKMPRAKKQDLVQQARSFAISELNIERTRGSFNNIFHNRA